MSPASFTFPQTEIFIVEDTRHLHIEFFYKAVENRAASEKKGRPVFDNTEMVKIQFVGDNKNSLVAPAHSMSYCPEQKRQMTYAQRFPRHYDAFKREVEVPVDGTPLSELPGMIASRIAEMKRSNVHTIEQLASLDGPTLQKLGMGARKLKHQAEDWLANADAGTMDMLKAQIAELQAKLDNPGKPMGAAIKAKKEEPETVQGGPFEGMGKKDLRALYKEHTGQSVKGQPSLDTLLEMLDECGATEALAA